MPKKHKIKEALPSDLTINGVIGPLTATKCGNCAHVIFPKKWIASTNIYVIRGNRKEIERCERCSSDKDIIYCDHIKALICPVCCKECDMLKNCSKRD